ncbi:MAG: chemotaxis protein CheW [Candidatus Omnitrophica bacterium]|nr:chemotaxis protein CheW [Candidatus Omnitrophota bacterium]
MATTQENMSRNDILQLVCFNLADEEYALDIHNVQEVMRVGQITHVPQMPEYCLGVMNIRGDVTAVFDLRKIFKLSAKEFDEDTRILAVTIKDTMVGLVVDEVLENMKLDSSNIDPTPEVRMNIERECIRGLGEVEGRMIVIMDLLRIHEYILKSMESLRANF